MGNLAEKVAQITKRLTGLGDTVEGVTKGFGDVSPAARKMIEGIGSAIASGKEGAAAEAGNLVAAVSEAMLAGAGSAAGPASAGNLLTQRFASAISAGRSRASAAARSVGSAANFSSSSAVSAAKSAGANLTQGFASGISSRIGSVISAVNRVISAAVSRIRSGLKIHSPSKVTFEIGGYFGEGFSQGIRASLQQAQLSAAALATGAAEAVSARAMVPAQDLDFSGLPAMMQQAVNDALGGTSFVIPLHVDGMKLGEASIRGINRVTRSAGRLMLEI